MNGPASVPPLPTTPFVFYDSEDCRVYLVGATVEQVADATGACGPLLGRPFCPASRDFLHTGMTAVRGRGFVGCARTAAVALELPLYVDCYLEGK